MGKQTSINLGRRLTSIQLWMVMMIAVSFLAYYYVDKKQDFKDRKNELLAESRENQENFLRQQVRLVLNLIAFSRAQYIHSSPDLVKERLLLYIETIRFEHGGYVFINTYQGKALVFDGSVVKEEKYINDMTDPDGKRLFDLELAAARKPEGGFMDYRFKPIGADTLLPKISFMMGYDEWEWIIGAGFYLQDIQKELSDAEAGYKRALRYELIIGGGLLILISVLTIAVGRKVIRSIQHELSQFKTFFDDIRNSPREMDITSLRFSVFQDLAREANAMIRSKSQAEKELQESEQNYKSLIEQAGDAILTSDKEGKIIQANPPFYDLVGYGKEEISRIRFHDLFTREELQKHPLQYQKAEQGHTVVMERMIQTRVGTTIPVEMSTRKVNGPYYLTIMRNISVRKKTEDELNRYRHKLEEEVKARTQELERINEALVLKNQELERYNHLFAGREKRIKELRDTIQELQQKLENPQQT